MPEYFDISLIVKKTNSSKEVVNKCLIAKFRLSEAENENEYFGNRKVLVSYFEDEESDFDEICIGFPLQIFHKEKFEEELKVFTYFINTCFECCMEIQFALCSYELNGYLLNNTKKLKEFNDELLSKFPIYFKREVGQKFPVMVLNLKAQEILV